MAPVPIQSVLITGCSAGGIGSELALEFQRRGLRVFATARTPSKMDHLASLPNVTLLQIDVTDQSTIDAAAAKVRSLTGGKLNYLINNSGAQHVAPVLETGLAEAQALFDVNFFGVLRVTQAFAPLLIAATGCVVNLCSISGHLHTPWMGVYQASKAAAEMLSETMRLELRPLGVRVISLVTGAVDTNIMTAASKVELSKASPYKVKAVEEAMAKLTSGNDGIKRTPADEFAKKVVDDVLDGASGRLWRGQMAGMISVMTKVMPSSMLDNTLIGNSGLQALPKKV
ncbi:NADPH-dependent 1-acyldihydroxyacetone phosphate reductase [Colletotrichum phormii]|uniref:NADPH-dependent 1-acyldihydroxyacetone phosphate reductase n=1 Tax=Colletotrichum phormii TaxID=359342 RepID=A0AAI9ZUC5_9PEZI|nr:NADPH-dependent 1-acyldihydroxyacetone phosphate reductase [Colletotrichum phormii]KAK1638010.1 NADPH-dependent 1-acyldihydroxyacetone phosphate reductase [Colletotrichum phormii]